MVCTKCGGEVWDNRSKKAEGKFKPNAPDFSCKDKACGWNSGFGKATTSPVKAPSVPQDASEPPISGKVFATGRDAAIQELFWDSFDAVLAGVAKRKLTDLFKPEHLASLTATMFIQRSRG